MSDATDYARGYAEGRRRAAREHAEAERANAVLLARYALAAAIAPEIIRNPWQRTHKGVVTKLSNTAGISETVADLVKAIGRQL